MQIFGLISVLIAVLLGVWWAVSTPGATMVGDVSPTNGAPSYDEAIDMANDIVGGADTSVKAPAKGSVGSVVVYDGVTVPADATTLNLANRGLTGSLKAEIRQLTQLRELDMSGNGFTGVPAEVGQLSQLEVLNLSHNPITGLPHEIGNLKNLRVLDLRGTNYSAADLAIIKQTLPASTEIKTD